MFGLIKKLLPSAVALSMVAGAMVVAPLPTAAGETASSIVRGAKLYDKWYKVVGQKAPKDSHAAYPKDKKYAKKPGSNWRCKECHGWDNQGKDGAYKSGKHNTGIKGINGMAGTDTAKIAAVLKDKTHGLAGKLNDADFQDLAMFVSKGQIDFGKYIDAKAKKVIGGDAAKGAAYYNTVCANCHGVDGSKPKDMGKSLGSQMGNPWEVMHKIVFGQPDEKMPALREFGMQPVLDIMAHIDTLPKKKLK
ncbi:MAG: c-type cytochrome [Rhodospirillales bacterium]|nr:c-type cytochrome [Rhodospirillales bacterium]